MKKVSFVIMNIFVFLLGFGCSLLSVNATTIAEKHVCTSNSEEAGDANTCNDVSISSKTSTISIGNEDPECIGDDCDSDDSPDDDVCKDQKKKPFDILFLIDNSGSMDRGGKYQSANNIIRTIFRKARQKVKGTKQVHYILFNDNNTGAAYKYTKKNLTDEKDILKSSNVNGSTYTQGALKYASNYFEKNKYKGSDQSACDDNIPVLVLLTDGYPTAGTPQNNVSLVTPYKDSAQYRMGNYTSAKYAYYVLRNMYSLKRSVCGGKLRIITIGLGMDKADSFAKYMLDPSESNYNNLRSPDARFTEATRLGEIVSSKHQDEKYYEAIASLTGASEYGVFRGTKSGNSISYKVKMSDSFLNTWNNTRTFRFHLLIPTNSSNVSQITYTNDKGETAALNKQCYSTNRFTPTSSENFLQIELWPDCSNFLKNGKLYGRKITNIKVDFGSTLTLSPHILTNDKYYTDFNNLVAVSKIGTAQGIEEFFRDSTKLFDVECKPNDSDEDEDNKGADVSEDYKVIGHTLCTEETFNVENYYIKTSDWVATRPNQTFDSNENGYQVFGKHSDGSFYHAVDITRAQCVPVTLKIPVVVTQGNATFSVGSLATEQTTHRGGGIHFNDVKLENTITWEYAKLSTGNKRPVYNIASSYYMRNKSGNYRRIFNIEVDDNDVSLYSDSTCSKNIWYPPEEIAKKILTNMGYSNSDWTFTGVAKDLSGSMVLDVFDNGSNMESIPSTVRDSLTYYIPVGDYRYLNLDSTSTFQLQSYIHKKTAEVVYKGSNPDGTLYDDAGSYYYTPLDYKNKTINVKINSAYNFANYPGVNITFKGTCPVTIDQVDPTPPGGGDDDKYGDKYLVYRPIDVENPFPHSSNKETVPINWRDWYCGSDNTCSLDNLNKKRIAQSYQHYPDNPLYSVTLTESNRGGLGNQNYNDWSNIDASTGTSVFISSTNGFLIDHSTNSYCGLGRWNVICDIYS